MNSLRLQNAHLLIRGIAIQSILCSADDELLCLPGNENGGCSPTSCSFLGGSLRVRRSSYQYESYFD